MIASLAAVALSDVQINVVPRGKQNTNATNSDDDEDSNNSDDSEAAVVAVSQATRKEEDDKLLETFLQFCVTTLRDADLPMSGETFFSKMGRVRRASTELNLKVRLSAVMASLRPRPCLGPFSLIHIPSSVRSTE